jgi:hypothetical protein
MCVARVQDNRPRLVRLIPIIAQLIAALSKSYQWSMTNRIKDTFRGQSCLSFYLLEILPLCHPYMRTCIVEIVLASGCYCVCFQIVHLFLCFFAFRLLDQPVCDPGIEQRCQNRGGE